MTNTLEHEVTAGGLADRMTTAWERVTERVAQAHLLRGLYP